MRISVTQRIMLFALFLAFLLVIGIVKVSPYTLLAGVAKTQPVVLNVPAPELTGTTWLNTPEGAPISWAARRGKVTIVQFWTFGCINCRRNLPSYARWHKQFAEKDVTVIGVHTPETSKERVTANVIRRVKELGIEYPILLDQQGVNWERWNQQFWPTVYLIDKKGRLRYRWEGELEYNKAGGEAKMAQLVEQLLKEP